MSQPAAYADLTIMTSSSFQADHERPDLDTQTVTTLPDPPTLLPNALASPSQRLSQVKANIASVSAFSGAGTPMHGVPHVRSRVKVAVRMRPMSDREHSNGDQVAWTTTSTKISPNSVVINSNSGINAAASYNYDHVFDEHATNGKLFEEFALPIVNSSLQGYNGTMFAYGQTGSGKTHSISGEPSTAGLTTMALKRVFEVINASKGSECLLRISYLELYNERFQDLLKPENSKRLRVVEDKVTGVHVRGLKEVVVECEDDAFEAIRLGETNRRVGSTRMNERSSRSHTVIRLVMEHRSFLADDADADADDEDQGDVDDEEDARSSKTSETGPMRVSILNLVDLAGSERVGLTGAKGEQLQEAAAINKSLTVLGLVIMKLAGMSAPNPSPRARSRGSLPGAVPPQTPTHSQRAHVPFRDSKLTRILSSSLGGNANTGVLCCVSPTLSCVHDTESTLDFAARAMCIVNHAMVNEIVPARTLVLRYKSEIKRLRAQLLHAQQQASINDVVSISSTNPGDFVSHVRHQRVITQIQCNKRRENMPKLLSPNAVRTDNTTQRRHSERVIGTGKLPNMRSFQRRSSQRSGQRKSITLEESKNKKATSCSDSNAQDDSTESGDDATSHDEETKNIQRKSPIQKRTKLIMGSNNSRRVVDLSSLSRFFQEYTERCMSKTRLGGGAKNINNRLRRCSSEPPTTSRNMNTFVVKGGFRSNRTRTTSLRLAKTKTATKGTERLSAISTRTRGTMLPKSGKTRVNYAAARPIRRSSSFISMPTPFLDQIKPLTDNTHIEDLIRCLLNVSGVIGNVYINDFQAGRNGNSGQFLKEFIKQAHSSDTKIYGGNTKNIELPMCLNSSMLNELRLRLCESQHLRASLGTTRRLRDLVTELERVVKCRNNEVGKLEDELIAVREALEQVIEVVREYVLQAPAKVL